MEFKLVPHQNTFSPSFEDIKKDPLEKESMLDLFIKSLITLKMTTKSKYLAMEKQTDETVDKSIPKINIQTYVLIKSLKLFIKWYANTVNKSIIEFVQERLLREKDDLYFTELKVNFEEKDLNTIMTIIDALGVKFYQKVILFIDEYFNSNREVFIIEADTENNTYKMSYRAMNIMEIDNLKNGKMTINSKA